MKIHYQDWKPKQESLLLIDTANEIIDEYNEDGYTLTLRQLYYQFVSRDVIPNSERSYKNLGSVINKGRMAGLVDWNAIEDRNREHHSFWFEEDISRPLCSLEYGINYDRWSRQPYYVEVWVEKEALGNVVERACDPLEVPYMSCKGYLSASEAWRAGMRFKDRFDEGKQCVLIHLGDHDPSGIDMTRDNQARLDLFTQAETSFDYVDVQRIALNMDQIRKFNPPPNPAKITDSRAKGYISKFGRTSWELDALPPKALEKLISGTVEKYIDRDLWDKVNDEEAEKKRILRNIHKRWPKIKPIVSAK